MKSFYFILFASVILFACSSDEGGGTTIPTDTFDRTAMLTHWANDIIKPNYVSMSTKSQHLQGKINVFTQDPKPINLVAVRSSFKDAYKQFQHVSMFEIGKAEELRLRNNVNTYPTDVAGIQANIENGSVNLNLSSEIDTQGFPAIEYLLYGVGSTDDEIIAFYTTHANATKNKAYLNQLGTRLHSLINEVNQDWQGNYANTFIANSGTSASSSVNKIANDYMFYYEKAFRAGKVGIPAGVFSNEPLPNHVECLYEGASGRDMLLEALTASKDFFNGSGGLSFAGYLNHLDVKRNGKSLATIINNQFDVATTQIKTLPNSLKTEVENNNTNMLNTYDELQKNVVYLKVDMMQALNISIDYVDADGD